MSNIEPPPAANAAASGVLARGGIRASGFRRLRQLTVQRVVERGDEALLVGRARERDLLALRAALADEERRRAGDLVGDGGFVEALGLTLDRSAGRETNGVGHAHARDARHGLTDHRVAQPTGVLRALVVVEELGEVERPVLGSDRDHRVPPPARVGADEVEEARHDLHLLRADVLREDVRKHLGLELLAERALEVDVLDHRHRRARVAERQAGLRDPLEHRVDVGRAGQRVRERADRRQAGCLVLAPASERDREHDPDRGEHDDAAHDREHLRVRLPPAHAAFRLDGRGRRGGAPHLFALLAARHRPEE